MGAPKGKIVQVSWLIVAPLVFLLPGWALAQAVTGRAFTGATALWALFFGVVLMPPLCFGVAMALGTVVTPTLALAVGGAFGALGLILAFTNRRDIP
jgi:hypothetical protein